MRNKTAFAQSLAIKTFLKWAAIPLVLVVWLIVSGQHPDLISTPRVTVERLISLIQKPINNANLFGHIWISLQRVLKAFLLATVLGVPFGFAMGKSRFIKAYLGSVFDFLRPIPPIAWIPLAILWFGIGETSKVMIIFIAEFIPIVINTYTGTVMVESLYIKVGNVYGANAIRMFKEIMLPSALPAIIAGMKSSISSGWMVMLAAEMIAARRGLGFLITRGMESNDIAMIMVSMICIGVVGALLSMALQFIEKAVCKWRAK